jgi:NAD(P)-dependent dehydrogenase (short-subunit alcohol dehydrogenase family)
VQTGLRNGRRAAGERVALVTGGTDGIGAAVALQLARAGDRVLLVGRDVARGAQMLAALRVARPGVAHAFLRADLSLLSETARVADHVAQETDRLDAIVCCAGILSTVPEWTAEGLERNFALNYLSRYLLARKLLPVLMRAHSGRLVLVSNAGRYGDCLDFDDLQYRRGRPGLKVAARSQFANDLFATELADRLRDTRVEVTCVYPGIVNTGVFRNARGLPWIVRALVPKLQQLMAMSPEVAAQTPVFLAQHDRAVGTGGRFFGPRLGQRRVPACAQRTDRRSRLWAASEDLVRSYLTAAAPASRPQAAPARLTDLQLLSA